MRELGALVPLNGFVPPEDGVCWKDKFRKVLLFAMLATGGFMGATMNPKEIEDLLRIMNQTQVELILKEESSDGDRNVQGRNPQHNSP